MSDVLSQIEIDNLLMELSQGNLYDSESEDNVKTKIKKYDFRTANKFTKEQIKTLYNIYSNFAQIFSTYLSGTLRTTCQVEVLSAEEQTYSEYINSLQSPVILAIIDMPPLQGSTLIEMSPNISYGIIDRLLGGKGGDLDVSKAFSDIDLALIGRVITQMVKNIENAWSRIIPINASLDRIETSAQFAQIVSYNDPTAIVTMCIKIADDAEGFINVCIPYIALEPIVEKLEHSMWASSKKIIVDEENAQIIKNKLNKSKIKVTARFKDTAITLGDFLALEPGDVLTLNHKVTEEVILNMENRPKFHGKLGTYDNKYAIKITDILDEEEIEDE